MIRSERLALGALLVALTLSGCASTDTTSAPPAPQTTSAPPATAPPPGVTYREDPDLQRVWTADGFAFRGYDAVVIGETRTDVAKLHPDGKENLEWARGLVREEIITALRVRNLFPTIARSDAEVKPGSRVLRLENTIVEYEKGGGGARFFAGLYGAGQPVLKVHGRLVEGDRPVFLFEARRSGDSGMSRVFGGYRSDKDIQQEDIRDLAQDLADFMAREGKSRR